jgi:tetratricopeptide (TPR) repeat protein
MMDHPNIAKVLDAGATETGRPYFVMELVRGIKITDYCDQNQLPTRERLELFIKVCQAVQHAHQKGIIHRDLKPSNILVTVNDPASAGVPKVIDFGIAKATEGKLTDLTVYTDLRQFIGTPAYMSPEQATMTSLDVDTRSDIYSLGVLLYELLAGSTPFDAKELMSQGLDAMRKTIREKEPVRPSTRLAALKGEELTTTAKRRALEAPKLIHLLKGDLDWIVMKCLEKDRTRRYETANSLAMDLQRHLGNEPVVARPPSTMYRLRKLMRRNKLAFAAGTVIVAMLVLGIAASLWQAGRANREARRALQAEAVAKERLAESQAVSKFMTGVFQSPDPTRNSRTITVAETLDRAATNLDLDLAAQPRLRAQLQATLGSTYYSLGLYREAIPLLEKARDYYLKTFGLEQTNTLKAMNALAISYADAGRQDEALKLREELLALSRKVKGPEHPDTLSSMNNLALSYSDAGRKDEALKLQEEVLTLRRKVLGPEHPDTLSSMNNLALSYADAGRRDEALKLREEVLTLRRKVNGPEHPDTLKAMQNVANSYADAGRQDEALKLREEVLALSRKVLGPEHPETLMAMNNLASSYADADRKDEALKLREEVLALRRKVLSPEHPDTLGAMHGLAFSYADAGRKAEALKLREELLTLRRKVNGPEHPYTLLAMNDLAISYSDAGRKDEALKLREAVLALRRKVLGPEHPDTLGAMHNLAISYADAGRKDEALKLREEVLTLRRKANGPEHTDTLKAMHNLAISYADAGRKNEALKLCEEVLTLRRKVNGPEHPDTLLAMHNLAFFYADAGRKDEALKLQEEMLALRRKVNGPEHTDTLKAMSGLASSYADAGRRDEALKLEEEILALRRKANGPEHPDTLSAMRNLAISYLEDGRQGEATALLEKVCELQPKNTDASLTLATWQTWFGRDADYEATRRRLVQWAEGTDQASTAERAAKAYCLRPSTDEAMLTKVRHLAQQAVKLGKSDPWLVYYRTALGLAEYRSGQYAAAEKVLSVAEQTAGDFQDPERIARLFRAMSLFRQDKTEEARRLFGQAQAQMPPLPKDESKPVEDRSSFSPDVLITWLAYKEAKALIEPPSAPAAVPSVPAP